MAEGISSPIAAHILDFCDDGSGGGDLFGAEMGEYQRMMEGGALVDADSAGQMAFPTAAEMQAARLSVEERKEKIHRYIKKRNERNFSKKIKYACRKTLADSRPRVRGRFAKNDEYCEASTAMGSQNHEEYEQMPGVKAEDMLDPDALAHISGMSSYMYNHTVESWI
ncbi:Zinc finger protein CONSTANS-LIKE 3 [Triticum urartu]|uniref:Zinc finger protein CONSTANS-LIKE 3 n=1 Tax=Triticum urartu TaxID=4572 RepID=M7ZRJ9_TRIUA|nr:Zinc finger protein CONSTANS-LIKE 3 [Triticum urartu]